MPDDSDLLRLMHVSNMRVRVKLANSDEEDRGSVADNDFGRVRGADVWLEDFARFTFRDVQEGLRSTFEARAELRSFLVIFHFTSGPRWEGVSASFERDGPVALHFLLSGGVPHCADDARAVVEQAFISVGAAVESVDHFDACEGVDEDYWSISLSANDLSATLDATRRAVQATRSRLSVFRGELGPDARGRVWNALVNGRFAAVLGEVECEWLECKSSLTIGSRQGNEEISKAVCGLANGIRSGLLVIGLKTENVNGRDTVVDVTPVPARAHTRERYCKVIDAHVVPPVRGLEVDVVEAGSGGVVVAVVVPAQRERDKPFVSATSIGSGAARRDVQLVYLRRGDRTIQLPTVDLHALLSAGYQTLTTRVVEPHG